MVIDMITEGTRAFGGAGGRIGRQMLGFVAYDKRYIVSLACRIADYRSCGPESAVIQDRMPVEPNRGQYTVTRDSLPQGPAKISSTSRPCENQQHLLRHQRTLRIDCMHSYPRPRNSIIPPYRFPSNLQAEHRPVALTTTTPCTTLSG